MKEQKNIYSYQKKRAIKRKLYLIDLRGSCCEICGYNKNLAALEFHHKKPGEKESQLDMRKLSNSSMDWIMKEFEKCKVVCANCHREVHNPNLTIKECKRNLEESNNCLVVRKVNKPKCVDCNAEINYTYKRCKSCCDKAKRKTERPDLIILEKEKNEKGSSWCSKKYGVTPKTIRKWLDKQIQ